MALATLAVLGDMDDRGIDISDATLSETMLDVASATVRNAAASPISQTESTVVLYAWGDTMLQLPGLPVQSVDTVKIDGTTTTDYRFVGTALYRPSGWGRSNAPADVEVTMTHGLPEIPADIIDLVCNLAAAGQAEAASMAAGGSFDPRTVAESIDDYRVEFAQGADAVASVFDLPAGARARLRARFGSGAAVVEYR